MPRVVKRSASQAITSGPSRRGVPLPQFVPPQLSHGREATVRASMARLEKLKRGESVSGGLGKKFDVVAAMKAAGWTPSMMRHARLLASLTDAEMKQAISRAHVSGAVDRAVNREVRRIIRARR